MDFDIDIKEFSERYIAVWNEEDPEVRAKAVPELWEPDGYQTTELAVYRGLEAVEAKITEVHNNLMRDAGYRFQSTGDVAGHHNMIVFTSHMVPKTGGESAWTARVLLVIGKNGRIQEDAQFTIKPFAG